MLDYRAVKDWKFGDLVHEYAARDTILHALGAGLGRDPCDEAELRFVYERHLGVLPSMATIFGSPGPWWRDPATGVDYESNLHAEQDLEIFAPIPSSGRMIARNRVTALHDRGPGRGALAEIEREIYDSQTDGLIAKSRRIEVVRCSGGFSAGTGTHDPHPEFLPKIDETREPDAVRQVVISGRAGLIYRLSGDYNPLHVDPAVARAKGFERPILHGLGTFAHVCAGALAALCDYDETRLTRIGMRFSQPTFPGDTLRLEFWHTAPGISRLRGFAVKRGIKVIDNGIVAYHTKETPWISDSQAKRPS